MRRFLLCALIIVTGCEGSLIGPRDESIPWRDPTNPNPNPGPTPDQPRGATPSPYACDPTLTPVELPLRRLTRAEYVNTVRAFAVSALPQSNGPALNSVNTLLGQVPEDSIVKANGESHGGFTRLDQTAQQATVDSTYNVAAAIAQQATRPSARLTELMGACATDTNTANDASCLSALVDKLGPLAVRHSLSAEDRTFFIATAGTTPVDPDAVADVLTVMMSAPGFLYHLESGAASIGPDVYALDAYELANRLSYHFWQSPPDAALRASAASGALLQDTEYRAQVARLIADPRADQMVNEFFDQWFRLGELGSLTSRVGTPQYDAFAGANRPSDQLRGAMFDDVLSAVRWTLRHDATLDELLTDSRQFTTSAELATIYEAPAWDGTSTPQSLPAARSGLLTRAAFLANDSATTRPIMKGLRIRNALLCDSMPPPPGNLMVTTPELAPDATTRQVVANLTEQPGSSCLGCHGMINPLGYASEGFDALGRVRTHQQLFDVNGNPTAAPVVDTVATPRIDFDDSRVLTDIAQVTTRLAESKRVDSCFARQYFRYSFQRGESLTLDACSLRTLDDAARAGSLEDALAAVAQLPGFKSRRIVP
ncbi:MAG: DUF1592 domain-containing protein [Archangium sp.]|nr:DUF1592 domain-containing protein [Archangium sp.]